MSNFETPLTWFCFRNTLSYHRSKLFAHLSSSPTSRHFWSLLQFFQKKKQIEISQILLPKLSFSMTPFAPLVIQLAQSFPLLFLPVVLMQFPPTCLIYALLYYLSSSISYTVCFSFWSLRSTLFCSSLFSLLDSCYSGCYCLIYARCLTCRHQSLHTLSCTGLPPLLGALSRVLVFLLCWEHSLVYWTSSSVGSILISPMNYNKS